MDHIHQDLPPSRPDAKNAPPKRVRRLPDGSIDVRYYERRARRLRARWVRYCAVRLWRRMIDAFRRSAVISELNALDERALRDIGIGRADIDAIASGDFCRDTSRRQRC